MRESQYFAELARAHFHGVSKANCPFGERVWRCEGAVQPSDITALMRLADPNHHGWCPCPTGLQLWDQSTPLVQCSVPSLTTEAKLLGLLKAPALNGCPCHKRGRQLSDVVPLTISGRSQPLKNPMFYGVNYQLFVVKRGVYRSTMNLMGMRVCFDVRMPRGHAKRLGEVTESSDFWFVNTYNIVNWFV